MSRGNEYCEMQKKNKNQPTHPTHKCNTHTHIMTTDIRGFPSRVLCGDVQLSLRDVNGFGGLVPTGGYHGSQRREGNWCVEEAVRGEPGPFGGGHQRLDNRQKVQLVRLLILHRSLSYYCPATMFLSLRIIFKRHCEQFSLEQLVANTQLS